MRRTELLRPELLLPVTAVARRLNISPSTVHNAINAGKLRCHLFGTARRVRPEDVEAYAQARAAECPPAGEDWRTVKDLMRAAQLSRPQAYRLLASGVLPFRVFAGVRYVRGEDVAVLALGQRTLGRRTSPRY